MKYKEKETKKRKRSEKDAPREGMTSEAGVELMTRRLCSAIAI